MSTPGIVFCDTETTGLDPILHEVWEVALIERRPTEEADAGYVDHETHLFIKPNHLENADPQALRLNRFYERTHGFSEKAEATPGQQWMGVRAAAGRIARVTANAVLVGSNPAFDAAALAKLLRNGGVTPAWHYRPLCVATMAFGYEHGAVSQLIDEGVPNPQLVEAAKRPDFSSRDLSAGFEVFPPTGDAEHTALADVRWVRDWYDALLAETAVQPC